MRLAGEVKPSPDMPVGTDNTLGALGVKSVTEITLFVNNCVVEIGLDLSQQRRANLLCNVQLLSHCYSILLYNTSKNIYTELVHNFQ